MKEKQHTLYSSILKCNAKEQACRHLFSYQTCRRIEDGSRLICDSIRSRAKTMLCAKYNRLMGAPYENIRWDASNSSMNHRPTTNIQAQRDGDIMSRVTVVGNAHISPNALDLLCLGPSFSAGQNINFFTYRKAVGSLHCLRDLLQQKWNRDNRPQFTITNSHSIHVYRFHAMSTNNRPLRLRLMSKWQSYQLATDRSSLS